MQFKISLPDQEQTLLFNNVIQTIVDRN